MLYYTFQERNQYILLNLMKMLIYLNHATESLVISAVIFESEDYSYSLK